MGSRKIAALSCFCLLGCAASVPASATRVLGAGAGALPGTPVCFAAPRADLSLIARSDYETMVRVCESAARGQGVPVVPVASGGCAVVAATWSSGDTGFREGTCAGYSCESSAVHRKSVRLTLVDSGNQSLAETRASINSSFGGFSKESYFALCSAAFYAYPQPLTNAQFDVGTE